MTVVVAAWNEEDAARPLYDNASRRSDSVSGRSSPRAPLVGVQRLRFKRQYKRRRAKIRHVTHDRILRWEHRVGADQAPGHLLTNIDTVGA